MAYISTNHSVGDIVFVYDHDTDSVQRLRVVGMSASSADATRFGGGEWEVLYMAKPAQACEAASSRRYSDRDLHSSARDAFPEILPECAPALETEAA
jgi:hypothetical protein